MYNTGQFIQNPLGVTVFGSAIIRVEPDLVAMLFSVSHQDSHPKEAFQGARALAQQVNAYLSDAQIEDFGSSRISLNPVLRFVGGESKFVGFEGRVEFQVRLYELNRVEEVLSGIVDAGANWVQSVTFQTTRLKELRAEARRRAMAAAREKAEIYCQAAGVKLGDVIHIEDINPDQLAGRMGGHDRQVPVPMDDDGASHAFDPSSIVVSGAVMVSYNIKQWK